VEGAQETSWNGKELGILPNRESRGQGIYLTGDQRKTEEASEVKDVLWEQIGHPNLEGKNRGLQDRRGRSVADHAKENMELGERKSVGKERECRRRR